MDDTVKACQSALDSLEQRGSLNYHEIDQVKSKYLGKSSAITKSYQNLGKLPPNEKKGALIKKEEILRDVTKKITIYWYKLNKLTPGKANSIPFIINFFRV